MVPAGVPPPGMGLLGHQVRTYGCGLLIRRVVRYVEVSVDGKFLD